MHHPRPTDTGAPRPHSAHSARLAPPAPHNPAAPDRGSCPPLAAGPHGLGAGPASTAVIGGREAKTNQEWVVYHSGRAIRITSAMEDAMAVMGWSMVLLVCEQPRQDLPSDTCLHRLLVSLVDIKT